MGGKRCLWAGALVVLAIGIASLQAQGPGSSRTATALFTALDANGDGMLTRSEIESGFNSWFTNWDTAKSGRLTRKEITGGLSKLLPAPPAAKPGQANTFNAAGNSTPIAVPQEAVNAMIAALPTTPGVKPLRPRKVLVFAHTGPGGFVHASIPLAAKTVEELGKRGGLWNTTVSYDSKDINANNLKQYDAIFLDSTTGCFLDDTDPSVTSARRAAFLNFVRHGKGIAAIHAATDSYHTDCLAAQEAANRGGGPNFMTSILAAQLLTEAGKDPNGAVTRQEWDAVATGWFQKLDKNNTGKIDKAEFVEKFKSLLPPFSPSMFSEPKPVLQWPEFNKLIGGYFKFHWPDPQLIYVKIDDPNSPLTAMFHGKEFEIRD
jgi:hypothetical protein